MDGNLGLRKTLHLGAMLLAIQDGQNDYARDKRPGMFVPHFAGGHAAPGRSRPKPHQHDLFATRAASMSKLCQPRAPHLTASLREQPVQASVPPRHLCLRCFRPARIYAQGHTYWNRVTATSVRVCWSCPLSVAPQLCRGADPSRKNQTCSLRDASMLYICQPRAPHFTSTAPRAASASLGIASAPFFLCFHQLGIVPQGMHTGIETR